MKFEVDEHDRLQTVSEKDNDLTKQTLEQPLTFATLNPTPIFSQLRLEANQAQEPPPKKKKKRASVGYLLFMIVGFATLGVTTYYTRSKVLQREAAKEHLAAVNAKEVEDARKKKLFADAKAAEEALQFQDNKAKYLAWCRHEGNVPLMTFGYRIVCVKVEAVSWEKEVESSAVPPN